MNFSIVIGAKDGTGSVLSGAASRFLSFTKTVSRPITIPLRIARKGLALARDIQLGLRPIVAGIDNLIERGSGLEVVRKSFESLMGTGGRAADMLARQLRNAANGTIRIGRAMEIANRGLASGLSFDQLLTSMDFVSKKAITTGMSADTAVDKVITGLARGSVLFLDDFGLVVDGLAGVSREYDRINGEGAFDSLGPAAQKAAIVAQAIKEMREQLGKIGVSGKETVFLFKGFKNQIGDAVDKLVLAIAKSKALKSVLTGFRNILSGITRHFVEGGSMIDLLLGKMDDLTGERSGGLFGIAKGALLDFGELIGRGILGGLLKGLSALPDLFSTIWSKLTGIIDYAIEAIPGAIEEGLEWLTTNLPAIFKKVFPMLDKAHGETTNVLGGWIQKAFSWLFDHAGPDGTIKRGVVDDTERAFTRWGSQPADDTARDFIYAVDASQRMSIHWLQRIWDALAGNPPKPEPNYYELMMKTEAARNKQRSEEQHSSAEGFGKALERWGKPGSRQPGSGQLGVTPQTLPILNAMLAMATGGKPGGRAAGGSPSVEEPGLAALLGKWADKLLSGGVLGGKSRFQKAYKGLLKDFPPEKQPPQTQATAYHVDTEELELTPRGRMTRENEIRLLEREIRKAEAKAKREARKRAAAAARQLYKDGYKVDADARKKIEQGKYDEIIQGETGIPGWKERIRELREEINRGDAKPIGEPKKLQDCDVPGASDAVDAMVKEWEEAEGRGPPGRGKSSPTTSAPATSSAPGGTTESDGAMDVMVRALQANTVAANQVFAALTGANAKLTQTA